MDKKQAQVIKMVHAETTPADLAISRCMQNMFATYGEKKVKATLRELFKLESKTSNKKVA